jgi:hypothetical protein
MIGTKITLFLIQGRGEGLSKLKFPDRKYGKIAYSKLKINTLHTQKP